MLNQIQLALLDGFIGNEGNYFATIRDYGVVDWGTKMLYLERAITQKCWSFLQSLDKLYQPALEGQAKVDCLDFIRAFKAINDLCFNNSVKYTEEIRGAVFHFFKGVVQEIPVELATEFQTGVKKKIPDELATEFQKTVRVTISAKIVALVAAHPDIRQQRDARVISEIDMPRQVAWRVECDLPLDQLELAPPQNQLELAPPQILAYNSTSFFSRHVDWFYLLGCLPQADLLALPAAQQQLLSDNWHEVNTLIRGGHLLV